MNFSLPSTTHDGSRLERSPRLSVVVVAYNMARELPRTLKSLSPAMQLGLAADEYEIIVVDNGSTCPFDSELCRSLAPNVTILREDSGSPSPVAAINRGLTAAHGRLIGVMIDGARMASPGLLSGALSAAQTHSRAIVGTLAFHLGDAVQMESVKDGYNQEVEDALLASIAWEDDGYRLFDISVFAGSSEQGWFVLPGETNALFMNNSLWQELGGFDERFRQPGGGLANLDVWNRACHLPDSQVLLLLGEGTFHQFHGGVATNSPVSRWRVFDDEYAAIRGHRYQRPEAAVTLYGRFRLNQMHTVLRSVRSLEGCSAGD